MIWAFGKVSQISIVAIAVVVSGLILTPLFNADQEASAGGGITPPVFCTNTFLPADPIEVRVERLSPDSFKMVAVEKELFDCVDSLQVPFVRENSVIITKLETKFGQDFFTNIDVIQCDKDLMFLTPVCTRPTFLPTITLPANCAPNQGVSFVEEASKSFPTTVGGNPVTATKFVIMEKEILLCELDPDTQIPAKIYEIFIFEELVNSQPFITIHTIICEKEVLTGTILGCQDFGTVIL